MKVYKISFKKLEECHVPWLGKDFQGINYDLFEGEFKGHLYHYITYARYYFCI